MAANEASSSAHAVLNYMISRAQLQGKTGTSIVSIPMSDMESVFSEGPKLSDDGRDVVLNVTIITKWAASKENGTTVEVDEDDNEHG